MEIVPWTVAGLKFGDFINATISPKDAAIRPEHVSVLLAELRRHKTHGPAWNATKAALKGFALAMLIEFTAGALMIGAWVIGVLVT